MNNNTKNEVIDWITEDIIDITDKCCACVSKRIEDIDEDILMNMSYLKRNNKKFPKDFSQKQKLIQIQHLNRVLHLALLKTIKSKEDLITEQFKTIKIQEKRIQDLL